MNILITGSSGFLGSALLQALPRRGHTITRLLRTSSSPDTPSWDPLRGTISPGAFTNIDAVIHLAGENIGDGRWTAAKKERIRQSRVQGTRVLCEHLARLDHKPSVLLAASGAGIYGDRGDEWVDEGSAPGEGFLATAAQEWEKATHPANQAGIRVVNLRLGVVLSRTGGALQK
ncbi:NAD-dependent epimerase/dehydratase family protein, partial [candidate division KSB3 bacterium]|nr:NAD-dependent epimerase/dehydratase family protein [candidate division KSB3 bacterium]MBD3323061.1 NAD-dependent epimerase/dehydratase family protein [candidate division KSB3 bacterium]